MIIWELTRNEDDMNEFFAYRCDAEKRGRQVAEAFGTSPDSIELKMHTIRRKEDVLHLLNNIVTR